MTTVLSFDMQVSPVSLPKHFMSQVQKLDPHHRTLFVKKFDFQRAVTKKRFSFGKFNVEIQNQHTQIDIFDQ